MLNFISSWEIDIISAGNWNKNVIISVGDSYSCYTEFQSVATDGCKSRIVDDNGSIVQATLSDVENSDFCVSGPIYGQAKQGLLPYSYSFRRFIYYHFNLFTIESQLIFVNESPTNNEQ